VSPGTPDTDVFHDDFTALREQINITCFVAGGTVEVFLHGVTGMGDCPLLLPELSIWTGGYLFQANLPIYMRVFCHVIAYNRRPSPNKVKDLKNTL
jgi:hypothetical protein